MQPKFTQRSLGRVCTKLIAVAVIFVLTAQASFSQQKQLSKEQLQKQQIEQSTIKSNDAGKTTPVSPSANGADKNGARVKPSANGTEAVCATFTGALTAGDPTLTGGRFFRDGIPSTCAVPKAVCPGASGGAGNNFDTHTWVNAQPVAQCVTVTITNNDAAISQFVSAYLGSFNPANVCTNYLADAGSSAAGGGGTISFSFTLPGSATLVLAVTTLTPGVLSSGYTLTVDGICTPCVPTNATAPVISSVPSTTCAGSPITLSILSGNLNGAANWQWYSTSCGGTPVGSGTSITVSPVATTTYYARGVGGCAPGAGPCGQQTVTVTPCTCLTPDASTICAGSIQRIAVNQSAAATTQTFNKAIAMSIPGTGTGAATGAPANPYPDLLNVTGLPIGATISSVTLNGFSHTFPSDVDVLLKSPSGAIVVLMSDAGGSTDAVAANITFSDAGAVFPAAIVTGTFRPVNAAGPDLFPTPGPGSVTQVNPTLASVTGDANGNWELYIVDDLGGDAGSLTGWSITFSIPANTATWAPVTDLFTNAAGTVPYVAGTPASVVFARPAATITYTATVNAGPCAGANSVTITVLTVPTVSVTPNNACSPATLTATGASIYTWTPGTGLNTTSGATVIATTATDATYTVTGIGANGCAAAPVSVNVKGSSTAAVISSIGAPPTIVWNEGFNTVVPLPAGWAAQNRSAPVGILGWFQGNDAVFPSQNGAPTAYIAANFNNTAGAGTISNWLFTPVTTLTNGDQLTFWTRTTDGTFPDRLQVRMSANGASTDVGASETSVGDFSTLLLDINPGLTPTGYPTAWALQTATVTGLGGPTSGRLALRYFVTNGGPAGANSDFIGIDNVTYQKPALATCANTTSTIRVTITGGSGPYTVAYTDGTTVRTIAGYNSGDPIQVTPGVTTTYTIVSVTSANGCAGSGNSGSAVITVTPAPSITTQPVNRTVCDGGNTTFVVVAAPALGTTYQWQVSTNGGTTYTNLANAAPYSGVTTPTLTITGVTTALSTNRYRVIVTGVCAPTTVTSNGAILTVNVPPTITTQPSNTTRCVGTAATFTVVATGNAPTYQWQVSTNSGLTFTNIAGATGATLTLNNITQQMNNNQYRVVVTVPTCGTTVTSTPRTLNVNALPVVNLTASSAQLLPGGTSTLTVTSTPGALTPASYAWTLNGVAVAGATGSTLPVDINGLGNYRASVTDINGCVGLSNTVAINGEASDRLFIYPNPTDGEFQVRLFYGSTAAERREVTIYNQKGQQVARQSFDLTRFLSPYMQMNFNLSHLAPGTYVVKVAEKNNGRTVSGLVVIQ